MLVTIIHDSDSNANVHKAGCADIKRKALIRRSYMSHWDAEVSSEQAAANDAWSDFIAEESMTEEDALAYTNFLPCTKGL
jgi:hypothetical protein